MVIHSRYHWKKRPVATSPFLYFYFYSFCSWTIFFFLVFGNTTPVGTMVLEQAALTHDIESSPHFEVPDWKTWDLRLDFPMTTRTFVKIIPQDTLVNLHWNTRVMSRRAPVQQMRVWKTTIPFSYFRTMILTALKIFFYLRRRTYLFTRSKEPRSIARHWRFRQENIHCIQLIYAAWPSESWPVGLPSGLSGWVGYASCTSSRIREET